MKTTSKKMFFHSVAIFLILLTFVFAFTACDKKEYVSMTYQASEGGSITGQLSQKIEKGKAGAEVTAVADEGYFFVRWDDGFRYPARKEKDVQKNKAVTAVFAPKLRVYKILLIYVTEIQATFTMEDDGVDFVVDYKMPEVERQICELTTYQMGAYLNDMLDGLVYFEVDSYFTTEVISKENFWVSPRWTSNGYEGNNYSLDPDTIPELWPEGATSENGRYNFNEIELFSQYNTVLVAYNTEDYYDSILENSAGSAVSKYGNVRLNSLFTGYLLNGVPFDVLLDVTFSKDSNYMNLGWDSFIRTFYHEFTHTIEIPFHYMPDMNMLDYHRTLSVYFHQRYTDFYATKMYLLGQAAVDGRTGGIPEWFWEQFLIE